MIWKSYGHNLHIYIILFMVMLCFAVSVMSIFQWTFLDSRAAKIVLKVLLIPGGTKVLL